ncbi:hypothetical protein [Arthrobacter sp. 2MCAF14]|uniref:hypothetical protein n=1 Tax=Arthrobacter sp. 2MCAF14 TaxID=3232982 RepID=UPI003F932D31
MLRRPASKLRRSRPILGLVMAAVMIGFAAAPTPLSPQAAQAEANALFSAQETAVYAASPAAAVAARAVFAPRKSYPIAPAMGLVEHDHPLGVPAPLASPSTSFAFRRTNADGTPVRYDPCRPIHYVTRAANEPEGGAQIIKDAVTALSHATGLMFIDDGATTEAPTRRAAVRPDFQPELYGDRWAPVLITWATSAEEPEFPEINASHYAFGGSESRASGNSPQVYVTGSVELNAKILNDAMAKPHGAEIVQAVLGHELGHVVGLDHDNNEGQLMNWQVSWKIHDYQPGDLAGLAILGQGKCVPTL